eukprot:7315650-Prymnesium_polylepis.2
MQSKACLPSWSLCVGSLDIWGLFWLGKRRAQKCAHRGARACVHELSQSKGVRRRNHQHAHGQTKLKATGHGETYSFNSDRSRTPQCPGRTVPSRLASALQTALETPVGHST